MLVYKDRDENLNIQKTDLGRVCNDQWAEVIQIRRANLAPARLGYHQSAFATYSCGN